MGGMPSHGPRWAIHVWIWARGFRVFDPHFLPLIAVLGLNLIVIGCAGTDRLPAEPLSIASKLGVDIPDVRFYPDTDKERMAVFAAQSYKRALAAHHGHLPTAYFLAISGAATTVPSVPGFLRAGERAAIVRHLIL